MTHDPLCPDTSVSSDVCTLCARIARERMQERAKHEMSINELRWQIGVTRDEAYAAALRDASAAVIDYGEERKSNLLFGTPADDITAALRVAATRIEALGGESWQ